VTPRALVAVSWCLPPVLLPRSVQVARTLKGLRRRGWDTTVVTPLLKTLPELPVIDPGLDAMYGREYATAPVDMTRVDHDRASWSERTRDRWFGDAGLSDDLVWIKRATSHTLRAVRRLHAAALVTFAQPWNDHLVGLEVKARKPRLPWIAHFSDPWTDSLYSDVTGPARDRELQREASVIERANRIVFTNAHAADLVMRKYPSRWSDKARVIPHAMDTEVLPPMAASGPRWPIQIVHVGNLFIGRRTGRAIFDAIAALKREDPRLGDRLRVVFLGEGSGETEARTQVFLHQLEDVVEFRPRVPYLASLQAMRASDALLLIDAPAATNVFLPSKLVDYLMAERPIVALTPAVGATADILRRFGGRILDPTEAPPIAAALADVVREFESGRPPQGPAPAAVADEFGLERAADTFAAVLDEVTGR
jgi:hypothetical protein